MTYVLAVLAGKFRRLCVRLHLHDGVLDAVRVISQHIEYTRHEGHSNVHCQWPNDACYVLYLPHCHVAVRLLLVQRNMQQAGNSGKLLSDIVREEMCCKNFFTQLGAFIVAARLQNGHNGAASTSNLLVFLDGKRRSKGKLSNQKDLELRPTINI